MYSFSGRIRTFFLKNENRGQQKNQADGPPPLRTILVMKI